MRGTWSKGSPTGDPERYAKQGSENGRQFPWGHAFGEHGETLLS
jgi:hypothetical protein